MPNPVTNAIQSTLRRFDVTMTSYSRLLEARRDQGAARDLDFLMAMPRACAGELLDNLRKSRGQLKQDLFALSMLGFKREGWFVEFGAANGIDLSNTYLLETEFGWRGVVAEPARGWHEALRRNRHCTIETACVWTESGGAIQFSETPIGELSTIDQFRESDFHAGKRRKAETYDVPTISLFDLLEKHGAPEVVDYLSIDTEGSEYDILAAFPFEDRTFRVITCEHNHTPMREKIFELLSGHGYMRRFTEFSDFDDWYVHESEG